MSCQIKHIHTLYTVCVCMCACTLSKWHLCDAYGPTVKWSVVWHGAEKVRGELGNRGDTGMAGRRVGGKNSYFTGYCPSWYERHQGAQTSALAEEGRESERAKGGHYQAAEGQGDWPTVTLQTNGDRLAEDILKNLNSLPAKYASMY